MSQDYGPRQFEILNEDGEPVEPPDGVTYSSSHKVVDSTPFEFDATGSHSCAFCVSPDWQWILQMKRNQPGASLAWPAYLVSCDPCQRLRRAGQLDSLRARIKAGSGPYMLEYLDEMLEQIESAMPRQ